MIRVMALEFKRNRLVKELNDRNLSIFNDIVEYIELGLLSSVEREEVFQQVLDMMLQAQSEGKFVSEVIGNDIKGFCDSIIEESIGNKNIFHICFNYIESIFQMGLIMFIITFIILNRGDSVFQQKDMFAVDIIVGVVVFAVVFPVYFMIRRKKIFKKKNKKDYSWVFLAICLYLALRVEDMIKIKFSQLANIYVIPHGNIIFLIIVFIIAFGRDICYLIKSIYKKICKNK